MTTDYSEHLVAARKALKEAEDAGREGLWRAMAMAAGEALDEVKQVEEWAWFRMAEDKAGPTV